MTHKAAQTTSPEMVGPSDGTVATRSGAEGRRPAGPPARGSRRLRLKAWYVFPFVAGLAVLSAIVADSSAFPAGWRVDFAVKVEEGFNDFVENGAWLYEPVATFLGSTFDSLFESLALVAPPIIVAAIICSIAVFRGLQAALLAIVTFGWILMADLWEPTLQTIAFMVVAVVLSSLVGLGLGLVGAGSSKLESTVRLVVDAMQAFPAFAYMIPAIVLLGLGNPAAMACTIIWAAPPLARMTSVGLRSVSPDVLEAAVASGANRRQLLFGVKIPLAAHSIRAGLNQTIMYAIAMATMAAMIGAEGLGAPVWNGLTRLAFGDALEAGIALVLVAILLDRVSSPAATRRRSSEVLLRDVRTWRAPSKPSMTAAVAFVVVVGVTVMIRGPWQEFGDPSWGKVIVLREPVDSAITWLNTTWGPGFDAFRDTVQSVGLNPLGSFFASVPWYVVVACTVLVAWVTCGRLVALLSGLGVLAIGVMGMWTSTVETLAVVTTAIGLVLLIAFPLGILMSASDRAAMLMRPVLDVMQTLPVFLWVIPAVILLGTGEVAGTLATFLAASPPMIRFTNAALRGVDPEVVEAGVTFGATPRQVLRQVRIPLGLPTLMVGLNQAVLLALAMAVVSAFIGSPGLGQDILYSLQRFDLSRGLEAGLAMFILAVTLDRIFHGTARMLSTVTHTPSQEEASA